MPAAGTTGDYLPIDVPIVAVVGATASGKTGLSLDLAERLHGEVVNTDAMQVYRGMDVGTAKLPPDQRRGIPHHLLDTLTVREPATVAEFQRWAREVIGRLRSSGAVPVLVGGSALYTRAILDRFEFPGTDEAVRARWEEELRGRGPHELHGVLLEKDPEAARQILPDNGRRIVRALEVVELTGRPFSASLPVLEYADPHTVQIGVDIDRETLDARIAARVDAMFTSGFVEEVRHLLDHGLAEGRTAPRAIGYREVVAHLRGELTEQEARGRTARATHRFARRQDSWFRKDPRIVWLRHDDPELVEKALSAVADTLARTLEP
jgi:tRNA dimethylallyltransferase